jgi:hypothetical protein
LPAHRLHQLGGEALDLLGGVVVTPDMLAHAEQQLLGLRLRGATGARPLN